METQRAAKGWLLVIGKAEFPGGLPHNPGYFLVMNVADIGEQVMLNLEVQPSDKPGKPPVARREVAGGVQLMYRP